MTQLPSRLPSRDVPQADNVETIIAMVRHLAGEAEEPPGLSPRHVGYYRHAARILGLVDEDHEVSKPGHALAHAAETEEAVTLVLAAFERCDVARAWLRWAGVERVSELDPGSAGAFLDAVSELSPSTAKRRAGTLGAWVRRMRALDRSPPSPTLERARRFFGGDALAPNVDRFLSEPVDNRVPTRMARWAARNGVQTFGDLVSRSPDALLEERNLGRTSVRKTRQVVERNTGLGWEELRARLGHGDVRSAETPADDLSWDALRRQIPEARKATPLEQIPLPKRMLTFIVDPRGFETLGELVACEQAALRAVPKLGRRTIKDAAAAIREHLESLPRASASAAPLAEPSLDDVPELMAHVLGRASRLGPLDRLVFSRRAGFHGQAPKLDQLGGMLGVSRERVRQFEKRAVEQLAREWWVRPTRARIEAALERDALPLEALARDELFSEADDQVEAFDYLLRRVIGGGLRVVQVGSEPLVARANPSKVEAALTEARRRTRGLDFPVPLELALEPARQEAAALCPGLVPYFERFVRSELTVADGGAGEMATGLGNGVEARLLAYLESLDGPVRRDVAEAAVGGRCKLPEAAIYVARGVIALPKHVPDFHLWMTRLSPLCIAIMREDPARQWSVTELLDEVSERAQLPEWMGHWHLASMLRHGGQVRYLGRLQVALDEEDAPEERRHIHDLLRDLVVEAGAPLPLSALLERMSAARGGAENTTRLALLSAPFVQVDGERFGLLERDLPGGPEALAEAANALEAELESRQQGVGAGAALTLIRELSPEHEAWTLEMAKTVARLHDAFRLNRSGGIGLADWDDERLPTRRAIVVGLVEQEGGRVSIARVMDAIETAFGRRPSRVQLGNLGSPHGLRLRGDELVREDLLETDAPTPVSRLDGLPASAEPLFRRLLDEPPMDLARLRDEARAYVEVFERAREAGSFIDPEEARRLADAAIRLLDRVADGPEEGARLARAAVRYFLVSADAENDFAVGGLDDDAAVLNAVAHHLGHEDCLVQLAPADTSRGWIVKLPRGPVRDLFAHVASYGSITEPEALGMLGCARELRRFARRFETHTAHLPFRVRIEILDGVKRYVREGTRS